MPIGHLHRPGVFDAGHCRTCARQAELLDHYLRVQGEEARLRQASTDARTAHRYALWALGSSGLGVLLGRGRPADMLSRPPGAAGPADQAARYEIRARGVLDGHWSGWFEGLQVSSDAPDQTLIAGPVAGQAALNGRSPRSATSACRAVSA